ncbi:PqiC family protein [Niveispirillum irakense]|uniref:PqiC family protein n=1 Tax=Niveispirillum irakense TaxID=34011 RepID=UPI0004153D3A|nr:PqiC family protein [Niveispirillum irakense]
MTINPRAASLLLLPGLLVLGACASDPPALVALPAAPAASQAAANPATLLLRPVTIPGYLDNLNVVTSRQGGSITQDQGTEWAERLGDGTTRVLAGALSDRLGPGNLLIEGDGRIPDADLSIQITRMDPQPDGKLVLEARWTLVGSMGDRPVRAGTESISVPFSPRTPAGIADATAQALGQLADRLVVAAETFPRMAQTMPGPGSATVPR